MTGKLFSAGLAALIAVFTARADVSIWSPPGTGTGGHTTHTNEMAFFFGSTNDALNVFEAINGGSDLNTAIGGTFEPSGMVWHEGLQQLIVVDDGGWVAFMNQHGGEKSVTNMGSVIRNVWSWTDDDMEAITVVDHTDTNSLWIGLERGETNASMIIRLDRSNTGVSTGHDWYDVTGAIWPTTNANWALEAMTWVPYDQLPHTIIEDYSFSATSGLFLVSRQEDGKFFWLDIEANTRNALPVITQVDTALHSFFPSLDPNNTTVPDVSDIHWDQRHQTLYVLVDGDGTDGNDPGRTNPGARQLLGYSLEHDLVWAEWWLPGWTNEVGGLDNPEALAIGQERNTVYIGNDDDDAALNNIYRYDIQVLGETDHRSRNVTMWRDPTVNDDSNLLYSVGSQWDNPVNGTVWFATNVTAGAAVWEQLLPPGGTLTGNETGTLIVAHMSANVAVPHGGGGAPCYTALAFDSLVFDRLGEWNTNTYVFTPNKAKRVEVWLDFPFSGTTGADAYIFAFKDSGCTTSENWCVFYNDVSQDADYNWHFVSSVIDPASSEILKFRASQNSGVAKTIYGGTPPDSYHSVLTIREIEE